MAIIGIDEIFGGVHDHELVSQENSTVVENADQEKFRNFGIFGEDYTNPQDAEDDCTKYHTATLNRDVHSAIRRRAVGSLHARKAWKILKFNTPKDFAKTRLGAGLNSYDKIARLATVEALLAKKCKILHFLEMCLRDSFFCELDKYSEYRHVAIAEELSNRQIALKGRNVHILAEELGIPRKNGDTKVHSHVKGNDGEDETPQIEMQFSDDERRSAWECVKVYQRITGNAVSVGYLSTVAMNQYLYQLKQAKTSK